MMRSKLIRISTILLLMVCCTSPSGAAESNAAKPGDPIAPTPAKPASDDADCPFAVAHDKPLDAKESPDREKPDHVRLRVEFNGIRGDRVPGYLYLPHDDAKAPPIHHPAVLLQYGSGGNKNTNYIVALGEQFVAKGFVVLTIDVADKGDRRKPNEGVSSMLKSSGAFAWYLGDYSRAIDYLAMRPEVDHDRIGYAGISWGAITGLVFVAHEPRVHAMASIVGGGNWLGAVPGVEWPKDTLDNAKRIDPIYHVAKIAPRPLLLLNAKQDQLVPKFFGESLHKAAGDPPSVTKRWIDTDHFFTGVDRYAILADVIDFMQKGLDGKQTENAKGK